MSYNDDFTRNPHMFANTHTLYPYADPVTNAAHMKSLALNDHTSFTEVRGDNKVAYCKIKAASEVRPLPGDMSAAVSYSDHIRLWVLRVKYTSSRGAIPCYYLPWQKDHMLRIKLKPSVHHAATSGLRREVVEPNLFVTAALQGCSIMVSGDPRQPVVYHLNASSTTGPAGETFGGGDAQFDIAARAKVQHMRGRFDMARAQHPKEGPPVGGFTTAGAHVTDYMPGVKPMIATGLQARYWPRVKNRARARRDGSPEIQVGQFGTVFGVRKSGLWSFYRQTRTVISYRPTGSDNYVDEWVDPVAVRFWP